MAEPHSATSLRILFLLPFPPRLDATHGGGKVTAQMLEALSEHHQVMVVCMRAPQEPPADAYFQERCDQIVEVVRPWAGAGWHRQVWRLARLFLGSLLGRPMWLTDWYSGSACQAVRKAIASWKPEILQAEFHIMGQYLPEHLNLPPKVLVEHEPASSAAPYLKAGPEHIRKILHAHDQRCWRQWEQKLTARAQAVIAFTHNDQSLLVKTTRHQNILCIPFGIRLPGADQSKNKSEAPETKPVVLFTGNFIHPPNQEAALRLAGNIFPLVTQNVPDAQLVIVGPNPPERLRAMASGNVVITGMVADIAPYIEKAQVVAAPLSSGGGMRVKLLEALAAGKAIVASPLAAQGLNIIDGQHILLAETDQQFSNRIIELLNDPGKRGALADFAKAWARENLRWDRVRSQYEAVYRQLLQQSSQEQP
jgi:polysaccharide biosynthesis protein PslH